MVWACVWLDEKGHPRRSKLVIMERDPDAKKRGYSAKSYMEALKKGLLPHYRRSQLIMQDSWYTPVPSSGCVPPRAQHHNYPLASLLT
jgi:hypothetical protein